MPIDRIASVCALARNLRDAIDPARIDATVDAAQLKLVLDTLLELGAPPAHARKTAEAQARTIMGQVAASDGAWRARVEEDDRQASVESARVQASMTAFRD